MKKLILILMLWPALLWASADTTYLVDIRTDVRYMLGGQNLSTHWSDDMIDAFINMGCREYAKTAAEGIGAEDTIITSSDTSDYQLNDDFIERIGVVKLSGGRKVTIYNRTIDPNSPAEITLGIDNVGSQNEHPRFYNILMGLDSLEAIAYFIRFDPASSSDGDTILVDYKRSPARLSGDSALFNLPYVAQNFVENFAYYRCLMANKDQPGVTIALPNAEKDYSDARNTVMNTYAPKYDPNWVPAK